MKLLTSLHLLILCHYPTDDVYTCAVTRRLRQDGSLISVLSTEESKSDEELLELSHSWDIVGKDLMLLVKGVCKFFFFFLKKTFQVGEGGFISWISPLETPRGAS